MPITPTNIFIIETPLQLINAIEAKHHFSLHNNLLLLFRHNDVQYKSFRGVLDKADWDFVEIIDVGFPLNDIDFGAHRPESLGEWVREKRQTFRTLLRKMRISKFVKRGYSVNRLLVGNLLAGSKDYLFHIANNIQYEELVLLDDGTDTLRNNEDRRVVYQPDSERRSEGLFSKMKDDLRDRLLSWDQRPPDRVTFFTTYGLNVLPSDKIVKNNYDFLKNQLSDSKPKDCVYFLGQCLIEDGYIAEETFVRYVRAIGKYFENIESYYVPHPRESESTTEIVIRESHFRVCRPGVPMEVYLATRDFLPTNVSTFFSSALENCRTIFGNKIKLTAFYLLKSDLTAAHDVVGTIYKQLDSYGSSEIEIIRLNLS